MFIKDIDNEKELLLKMADGHHMAFNTLFYHYHDKIYNYALKICQSEVVAEEVVQDVFMKVWLGKENAAAIENIGAYLMVMCRNHCFLILKRTALEVRCNADKNTHWTELDRDTENYLDYKETRMILEKALSSLPKQQKLVYHLCHVEGMKQQEVASQLSISRLTVKAHLRQAVKTVRAIVTANAGMLFFILVNQLVNKL